MKVVIQRITVKEAILYLSLLAYPALTLIVKGGVNTAFAVIALISISMLASSPIKIKQITADRTTKIFALAMVSGTLAILLPQIYYQQFDARPFDSELRFLLAIPVFMALRFSGNRALSVLEYAFPLGALATFLFMQTQILPGARIKTEFLDSIHVGGISMILGFMSLYSENWLRRDKNFLLILKLLGFVSGIYIAIRSGTRGVWLAMPILFLLWYAMMKSRPFSIKIAAFMIVIASLVAYASVDIVHKRVALAISNLEAYSSGKVNNGTAARLELWKVAFRLMAENPVVGIEPGSLDARLTALSKAGVINDRVMKEGKAEMHSEIAARMAKYGVLGCLSALAVFLIPAWLFYQSLASTNRQSAGAAQIGLCVAVGFFVFGLTVEVFNIKMVAAFYGLTIAIMMAATNISGSSTSEWRA